MSNRQIISGWVPSCIDFNEEYKALVNFLPMCWRLSASPTLLVASSAAVIPKQLMKNTCPTLLACVSIIPVAARLLDASTESVLFSHAQRGVY